MQFVAIFKLFQILEFKRTWTLLDSVSVHGLQKSVYNVDGYVDCRLKEPVIFDESLISRFGSTRFQFGGRTLYQSRIWSSSHERPAPAFERTLSSRSL